MKLFSVLLVEDNEGDVLLTKVALENTGIPFKLGVLSDGKVAIDFFEKIATTAPEDAPDIILLDINLPKKNGHEVLKFVKEHDKLKQIPVIILTTSSSQKDIDLAYANFANCFVTKPSEMDEFLNAIAAIVNIWFSISSLPSKTSTLGQ
jgi:CheY-like chemotaxis protein